MASDSALLSPSIQFSFPCLAKFCPAIGPKQFLYSLMVITAYRGKSHITAHCGQHHFQDGILDYVKGRSEQSTSMHFSLLLLWMDGVRMDDGWMDSVRVDGVWMDGLDGLCADGQCVGGQCVAALHACCCGFTIVTDVST